ncbi:MAG TPA: hypothetical protein VKB18_03540 [Gemmatimonadota bacterium]|nr:hypothetical protein [Gemmatimonadota bacterium]
MREADSTIVFRGCLFDATRMGGGGRIASRLYFEVAGPAGPSRTGQVDVTQAAGVPYGKGEVDVARPEGASAPADPALFARLAARYYRLVVERLTSPAGSAKGMESPKAGDGGRLRDVIVAHTWEAHPDGP